MLILSNPTIYNKVLTNANQEYSQQLSARVKYFEVQCRTLDDIKFSYASGASGTTYRSIAAGSVYYHNGFIQNQITLYFQSPTAGAIVEIVEWA